ncbi:tetratricopeptide repeat protein [bacterium]|nr:tetratricopeptide repeat protein [bacterium]
MKSRLEILQELVSKDANDSFSRYGLAMEYMKNGDTAKALQTFDDLLQRDSNYLPVYYQMAKALEYAGRASDAADIYRRGLFVAKQQNNLHALSELQSALDELEDS